MKSIKNDLYFIKPFEGQANATLEISEAQEGVKVDWIFSIDMPYPFNALAPFMGDNGVGADFNRGLEKLKKQCEAQGSTAVAGAVDIKEENIAGRKFVGIKSKVSIAESANWYRTNIAKVAAMLKAKGKEPNESPAGLYFVWDDKAGTTEMAAVYPVPAGMTVADKGFELFDLPAGKYAVNDFMGPYDQRMFAAHEALGKHSKQMTTGKMPVVEVYKVAPANTPDSTKWHTRIMYPM
jgi:predicted transcriptional regulator YdeE